MAIHCGLGFFAINVPEAVGFRAAYGVVSSVIRSPRSYHFALLIAPIGSLLDYRRPVQARKEAPATCYATLGSPLALSVSGQEVGTLEPMALICYNTSSPFEVTMPPCSVATFTLRAGTGLCSPARAVRLPFDEEAFLSII